MTNFSPRLRASLVIGVVLTTVTACLALVIAPASADKQADINLASGETFQYVSKRPMVNPPPPLIGTPTGCKAAPLSATCDVYQLKLELDDNPAAVNFVVLKLTWDPVSRPPSVITPAVGLTLGSAVDFDINVWTLDKDSSGNDAYTQDSTIDGGLANPELVGWIATRDTYFVTIQDMRGPSLGYTFDASFSNERFASPLEILDPAYASGNSRPVDKSGAPGPAEISVPVEQASVPFVDTPVDYASSPAVIEAGRIAAADPDFAGFRAGVDQQLAGNLASFTPGIDGPSVPLGRPPSGPVLIFWLLIAPFLLAALLAFLLRRRRPAELSD
jgi:hypothetical protein